MKFNLQNGHPYPLGAFWDGSGVNFAIFSAHAEKIELCLFKNGVMEVLPLPRCTDQVFHGYLSGGAPGLEYAFRVYGPDAPGRHFDPEKLLIDPYARRLSGAFSYGSALPSEKTLKSQVVHEPFDWGDDKPPQIAWEDTVLYEIHIKGSSWLHPDVPVGLRGTYAGLASPAMLAHFKRLGITAVKLLPVHAFLDEERLLHQGLTNYWGYNTLAYFAPESRYAADGNEQSAITELRSMVRTLHASGIEVILDVVFNHTAETDEHGPTISFRGIDNASYYRLQKDDPAHYENHTGCGNTFNLAHPRVLQLVMDALRYWVEEMHVDGFRFDLAATLTRDSAFLAAVRQDPVLNRVKLIAEPWDLGPDGYQLGRFPSGWREWNDRFRDDIRAFWLTHEVGIGTLAQRLAGSSDAFRHSGRAPTSGINFITAHDGFTLLDLVSYREKHNEKNGEDNRDGHNHNVSCNCGVEGPCDDPDVRQRRNRLRRALLATLFAAQGVPMLQGGDEIGRTQSGNNNAYCQDNALTWLNWPQADIELCEFVSRLIALRRRFPQLRRFDWLTGEAQDFGERDVIWWHEDGREMNVHDWNVPPGGKLGMLLAPKPLAPDSPGALLILFNRMHHPVTFLLPPGTWQQLCDSGADTPFDGHMLDSACTVSSTGVAFLEHPVSQ